MARYEHRVAVTPAIEGERLMRQVERVPQVVRFVATGGFCSLLQIALLYLLVEHGLLQRQVANALAFALSTQVNFALSSWITWRDRLPDRVTASTILPRLAAYNAMSVAALLINEGVFIAADRFTNYLAAAALGILVAAVLNYTISRRVIFVLRHRRPRPTQSAA